MLLVLFNKIRVHSYDTVLYWFLVSSLASLIDYNDHDNDRCAGVTESVSVFTADDKRLGLRSRQQVGVTVRVRVSSSRQGRFTAAKGALVRYARNRM